MERLARVFSLFGHVEQIGSQWLKCGCQACLSVVTVKKPQHLTAQIGVKLPEVALHSTFVTLFHKRCQSLFDPSVGFFFPPRAQDCFKQKSVGEKELKNSG